MSPRALAIVNPAEPVAGRTPLRWYSPRGDTHSVPGVPGFTYVSGVRGCAAAGAATPQFHRAHAVAGRHMRRLASLGLLLRLPAGAILPAALCGTSGPAANPYVSAFVETHIGSHRHFLFTRGARCLTPTIEITRVNFITGLCCFSERTLRVTSRDGTDISLLRERGVLRHVAAVTADPRPSLYELDGSVRLARLLADLASLLPEGMPYSVTLDVPLEQYYLYMLDAFERNYVNSSVLVEWFMAVSQRHAQVADRLRDQLAYWFADAGLKRPDVDTAAGLGAIGGELEQAVAAGRPPKLADLAAPLVSSSEVWRLIYETAPPQSFRDLANYSYSVEELRRAVHERDIPGPLAIAVEDHTEQKIYEGGQRLLRHIRRRRPDLAAPVLGFFSLPHFLVPNSPGSDIYLEDPGTSFVGDDGQLYGSAELMSTLYDIPGLRGRLRLQDTPGIAITESAGCSPRTGGRNAAKGLVTTRLCATNR